MRAALPEPEPEERAHSERVADRIRAQIEQAGGSIDFAQYMELALYAPGLGYYSAGATKFGAAGDFITAPELGFVFARCLARAFAPELSATKGDLLELGPGSGALAAELLLELERLDALPRRYRLLERSADLRERQRETIDRRCAHLLRRCEWLDAPPTNEWNGVLVANEVVDALPVRLFSLRDDGIFERRVSIDGRGNFVWRESEADAALGESIVRMLGDRAKYLPTPYRSEFCPMLPSWLASVTQSLQRGQAFFIDYGDTRDNLYSATRIEGTLRCHFRHRAHDDPLILPGLQDITAWVDFDALAHAATEAGLTIVDYRTQARFLIGNGIDEVFSKAFASASDEAQRYRLSQEIKRLTLPSEMGERFHILSLERHS